MTEAQVLERIKYLKEEWWDKLNDKGKLMLIRCIRAKEADIAHS